MNGPNPFAMALVCLTIVISSCNRVDEQRTGTQAHANSSVPSPQISATPKYLEGQRVKLGDETVVVVSHKCVAETVVSTKSILWPILKRQLENGEKLRRVG